MSWYIFSVIALTCGASVSLIFWLEWRHRERFAELGGRRIWTSAQFRYLALHDPVVTGLALLTQAGSIVALYLIFRHPSVYFDAR